MFSFLMLYKHVVMFFISRVRWRGNGHLIIRIKDDGVLSPFYHQILSEPEHKVKLVRYWIMLLGNQTNTSGTFPVYIVITNCTISDIRMLYPHKNVLIEFLVNIE